jgi:uncharacterized iron-regulated protein
MRIGVGWLLCVGFMVILAATAARAGEDCAAAQAAAKTGILPGESYPPLRIYDLRDGMDAAGLVSYRGLINELAGADIVFLGEQHDDPATHFMEWRILRDLTLAQHGAQALSLEMFERDVQHQLNAYLRGELSEDEFLAASRPWPNYPTDYRPLIELAKQQGLPVVAANIPRPLASKVAKQGLEPALAGYSVQEWNWAAGEVSAPLDLYWELFYATMGTMMGGHGGEGGQAAPAMPPTGMGGMPAVEAPALVFISEEEFRAPYTTGTPAFALAPLGGEVMASLPAGLNPGEAMIYQIYQAQCIKDDTMAESIARQRAVNPARPVLHVNGSFHSDYLQGTAARLQARRPQDRILTVTLRPARPVGSGEPLSEQLAAEEFSQQPRIADFILFVPAPIPVEEEPAPTEEATPAPAPMPAGV